MRVALARCVYLDAGLVRDHAAAEYAAWPALLPEGVAPLARDVRHHAHASGGTARYFDHLHHSPHT